MSKERVAFSIGTVDLDDWVIVRTDELSSPTQRNRWSQIYVLVTLPGLKSSNFVSGHV